MMRMAIIRPIIVAEINPGQPVQEISEVIAVVLTYHSGREREVLTQLEDAIAGHLKTLEVRGNGQTVETADAKRQN